MSSDGSGMTVAEKLYSEYDPSRFAGAGYVDELADVQRDDADPDDDADDVLDGDGSEADGSDIDGSDIDAIDDIEAELSVAASATARVNARSPARPPAGEGRGGPVQGWPVHRVATRPRLAVGDLIGLGDDMRKAMAAAQVAGLAAGVIADVAFGDPRRFHPVAGFGQAATRLEHLMYAPTRAAGARYAAVAVGVPLAAALAVHRATKDRPVWRATATAAVTWAVLGGTSLRREAAAMAEDLGRQPADDALAAARERLPHLVGRDPSALDASEIARATVESVAENTSDAQVAPLFWGTVAGLPGLIGYRAINTLDAMVGHRSPRYADFGTAAARLDDVANLVPSRLTAVLTAAAAPVAGGDGVAALTTWWRDGDRHPSPNSGQCEAAMAGALGVRLGGRNVYHGRVEERPRLGFGPLPRPTDVGRAARISGAVGFAALAICAAGRLVIALRRSRPR